ncbi:sodium:proton exchanger [Candidatus Uhrbacteria bacterium CG_4_10_14_0_8_um_filter_58_22]|uniref:Sodium:proton exchanger n=1 Tax=Candidatus Uhrbacteria bacterium CG_4_10_14_0_8_um_filter_58_22 TaxID=1975029 RepID=A0A2M7QAF5_9BACT|nr:MAG: sodium:proton exchanger [Parcubacteria group bacterium CG1_02_58_44]PIY62088.1 MAG: sodium:proton exchanger [Candidatus Uhrbacteria bacterium CG_4_10_14_0_8_um_filter_58_22]
MELLLFIFLVVIGFVLLVKGADMLVSGASSLAGKLGISTLVVGLTVVALGTSMPELVVNVYAALTGVSDIAIGNIVGSNIANIALILGLSAAPYPLHVQRSTVWKEIPFALMAVALVAIMSSDVVLNGMVSNVISRSDGLILLAFAVIFFYYILGMVRSGNSPVIDGSSSSSARLVFFVVVGIGLLVVGGKLAVDGAVGIAAAAGLSERVIGLTIVAIGTSLPELVTSLVAAYRKQPDLSVGNIVGSNILNIFLVLGLSSAIRPLPFQGESFVDVGVLVMLTLMLFTFMFLGRRHVLERWQGIGFVVIYVAFTVHLFF